MRRVERFANLALGASFASLGCGHWIRAESAERWSPVSWVLLTLTLTVAVLLVRRKAVRREAPVSLIAQAAPAVVVPLWADAAIPPPQTWPCHAVVTFVVGGVLAVSALLVLGRSFAILPAVRGVVVSGPYRVVRHPAYAGQLAMVAASFLAHPNWVTTVPLLVGVSLVVLRIRAEERLLRTEACYVEYMQRVRWRLLPSVW